MLGYLFEMETRMKEKKEIEKLICDIEESTAKKRAFKELSLWLEKENNICDNIKKVKRQMKCIEYDINAVDKRINSISSKLYGFGISEKDRLQTDKEIGSLNEAKADLYKNMMENMERTRRFSLDMRQIRCRVNLSKDAYAEINSEIAEKMLSLNSRLKKIKKDIKNIKKSMTENSNCKLDVDIICSDCIELFAVENLMCTNCSLQVSEADIVKLKNKEIVICRKCSGILYLKNA